MCRSGIEPGCTTGRRRCDGPTGGRRGGRTNATRKAERGYKRAAAKCTAKEPRAGRLFHEIPTDYWRTEERDAQGNLLSTRALPGADRARFITAIPTSDTPERWQLATVRVGLADQRQQVRDAAAAHPLAEQARALSLGPSAAQQEHLDRLAAQITKDSRLRDARDDQAYLKALTAHYEGEAPRPMSPSEESEWRGECTRLTGRAKRRFLMDRYRAEHEWEVRHGRTGVESFEAWWPAKAVELREADLRAGRARPRLATARPDWATMTREETVLAVRYGSIDERAVPMKTPGWRLGWRWQAEVAADAGRVDVAHAVDLAQSFNNRDANPRVRAVPRPDGVVVIEPTRLVRGEKPWSQLVDLRGVTDPATAWGRFDAVVGDIRAAEGAAAA